MFVFARKYFAPLTKGYYCRYIYVYIYIYNPARGPIYTKLDVRAIWSTTSHIACKKTISFDEILDLTADGYISFFPAPLCTSLLTTTDCSIMNSDIPGMYVCVRIRCRVLMLNSTHLENVYGNAEIQSERGSYPADGVQYTPYLAQQHVINILEMATVVCLCSSLDRRIRSIVWPHPPHLLSNQTVSLSESKGMSWKGRKHKVRVESSLIVNARHIWITDSKRASYTWCMPVCAPHATPSLPHQHETVVYLAREGILKDTKVPGTKLLFCAYIQEER